jgi:hypothetical protein
MKKTRERLWAASTEAHYTRHLTSCSESIATNDPHANRRGSPLWTTGDKTLRLVLSTAFSLQPRNWSPRIVDTPVTEMGDAQ